MIDLSKKKRIFMIVLVVAVLLVLLILLFTYGGQFVGQALLTGVDSKIALKSAGIPLSDDTVLDSAVDGGIFEFPVYMNPVQDGLMFYFELEYDPSFVKFLDIAPSSVTQGEIFVSKNLVTEETVNGMQRIKVMGYGYKEDADGNPEWNTILQIKNSKGIPGPLYLLDLKFQVLITAEEDTETSLHFIEFISLNVADGKSEENIIESYVDASFKVIPAEGYDESIFCDINEVPGVNSCQVWLKQNGVDEAAVDAFFETNNCVQVYKGFPFVSKDDLLQENIQLVNTNLQLVQMKCLQSQQWDVAKVAPNVAAAKACIDGSTVLDSFPLYIASCTNNEDEELVCNDGEDNNGDTLTDCQDPQCLNKQGATGQCCWVDSNCGDGLSCVENVCSVGIQGDENNNGCLSVIEYNTFKSKYKKNFDNIKDSMTPNDYNTFKSKYKKGLIPKCSGGAQ